MDLRDRDLISIQEARELAARADSAQRKFGAFSQEQVDAIVGACARAAADAAEALAWRAVEETGFGNVADKTTKNLLASREVWRAIRGVRTVGILREDREKGIVEVASPVGVVAAVIPSTNPTSTAIYKTLITLKARNAIVLSPHPSAIGAICETSEVLRRAAEAAGAPEGLINCMQHTTLAGTQELMRRPQTGLILATGGTGLVRAAYGSGKPAYGVGPGNVPAFIERSADIGKAVADVFAGKTFDYGTICSSEQALVVEEAVVPAALEECRRQGGHFLSAEAAARVGALVFLPGSRTPNTRIVGRPATEIARLAGIAVPPGTRVLIAQLDPEQVGREFPLSAEKLSCILAFYRVANLAAGIQLCSRLLHFGGLGHTCAIHSQSEEVVRRFGQAVPAFRVCVNTSAVHGAIGYSTNLFPAMTLGCGAPGGNITSDNIGPAHLINVKRIAWESRPVEHRTIPAEQRLARAVPTKATAASAVASGANPTEVPVQVAAPGPEPASKVADPLPARPGDGFDPQQISNMVERVLTERGIAGDPSGTSASADAPKLRPAAEIAAEMVSRIFGAAVADAGSGSSRKEDGENAAPPAARQESIAKAEAVPIVVWPFVSENDVRRAVTRSEKIFIGPGTIVTPSARDLGAAHDVFIETEGAGPA